MITVTYTQDFSPFSSLVDDVYYDADTRELTVDLNDEIYRYSGVPEQVFNDFRSASSAGGFYTPEVKRKYGPGDYLGHYDEINFEPHYPTADDTTTETPQDWVDHTNTDSSNGTHLSLTPAPIDEVAYLKHEVIFEVNGVRKVHTLVAGSVDEAVESVLNIGDMLNLTFVVKEVRVFFE